MSCAKRQSFCSTFSRVDSSHGLAPSAHSHSSFVRRTAFRSAASCCANVVLPAPGNPQVRINRAALTESLRRINCPRPISRTAPDSSTVATEFCAARELCEDVTMGWEALEQWGDDVARIEPLAGGVANDVWSVRINGRLAVGRLGTRSDADLAWEADLLLHLDRGGLTVPVPLPTAAGRLFVDGLVVMAYLEGGSPETEADWRRVAHTLHQLHGLTQGWPQRPGWRSSTDLLHADTGTKIDLGAMPPEGVARCRAAWARLGGRQTCVVHGNHNNHGNIRMTADRVALIDWDEAHLDVPDLDLVLPYNAGGLDDGAHDIALQASAAWEAAVCWRDEYAVKRLGEVRPV